MAKLGGDVSLRYALQLLAPARVVAKVAGRAEVDRPDVEECEGLFLDAGRSVQGVGGEGLIE